MSENTFKHDWYQSETQVTVSIMIKAIKEEDLVVEFHQDHVRLLLKKQGIESEYCIKLAGDIDPTASKFRITPSKIELTLRKVGSERWNTLEPTAVEGMISAQSYPSSAKKVSKINKKHDWDKVAKEVEKEEPEGEQALNAFFQNLYKDASDETKRAMVKSFTESNGTALSTNWAEIGKKKTEVVAPDGMEVKKFET